MEDWKGEEKKVRGKESGWREGGGKRRRTGTVGHRTEQSWTSSDLFLLLISLWPGLSDFQSRLSPAFP